MWAHLRARGRADELFERACEGDPARVARGGFIGGWRAHSRARNRADAPLERSTFRLNGCERLEEM
jgi:hypothetical protein